MHCRSDSLSKFHGILESAKWLKMSRSGLGSRLPTTGALRFQVLWRDGVATMIGLTYSVGYAAKEIKRKGKRNCASLTTSTSDVLTSKIRLILYVDNNTKRRNCRRHGAAPDGSTDVDEQQ